MKTYFKLKYMFDSGKNIFFKLVSLIKQLSVKLFWVIAPFRSVFLVPDTSGPYMGDLTSILSSGLVDVMSTWNLVLSLILQPVKMYYFTCIAEQLQS